MLYDKIISLGDACFISTEMRLLNKRFEAMPFDWIESNLQLIDLAVTDPAAAYESCVTPWLQNKTFKTYSFVGGFEKCRFAHHDPLQHEAYFQRCWARWTSSLNGHESILFLHAHIHQERQVINNSHIQLLKQVVDSLTQCYPQLSFHVVSIQPIVTTLCDKLYDIDTNNNLTILRPYITVPLSIHWQTERHIWDKVWDNVFDLFKIKDNTTKVKEIDQFD